MRILVATNNAGKVRELTDALTNLGVEVVGLEDAGLAGLPVPDETGTTFEANALLKARYYHERSGLATVADDSGLEVGILGGRPGVYSARYAPTDAACIERLLGELDHVPTSERGARFVCALALVDGSGEEVFWGTCDGSIRFTPAGDGGFGYDPIFVPEGETRSFAEMAPAEKRSFSHRGKAVRALAGHLEARAGDR